MAQKKNSKNKGEPSSVSEVFFKNELFLKKFLSRFLSRSQDIDDVAQEAFLKAFNAEKKQEIRSPKSFLFQIAKNIAFQELTKKSKSITHYIEDLGISEVLYEGRSVEDTVAGQEQLALFCRVAASLPSQCRRAFLMRKVYGMSHKEISEQLGIAVSTVEKHQAAGLKRCSEMMRKMNDIDDSLVNTSSSVSLGGIVGRRNGKSR